MPSQERYDICPPHEMGSNAICHPYGISNNQHMSVVARPFSFKGLYKKIGVCGGRSIYQHANNTDIFMYYGCGRWFIGLEIGVCGGWLFAKSLSICIHGQHEVKHKPLSSWMQGFFRIHIQVTWSMTSDRGLLEDRSLRVDQTCQEEYAPRFA